MSGVGLLSESRLDLSSIFTYRIARTQAKLNAQGARILRDVSGLSLAQWRIILVLGAYGEATPSEVSRGAQLDKGLLSRKVRMLIDDGLVASTPHPSDRRQQILKLTEAGQAVFGATLPHMQARQERLQSLFSEDELTTFNSMLERLEDALEGCPAE